MYLILHNPWSEYTLPISQLKERNLRDIYRIFPTPVRDKPGTQPEDSGHESQNTGTFFYLSLTSVFNQYVYFGRESNSILQAFLAFSLSVFTLARGLANFHFHFRLVLPMHLATLNTLGEWGNGAQKSLCTCDSAHFPSFLICKCWCCSSQSALRSRGYWQPMSAVSFKTNMLYWWRAHASPSNCSKRQGGTNMISQLSILHWTQLGRLQFNSYHESLSLPSATQHVREEHLTNLPYNNTRAARHF